MEKWKMVWREGVAPLLGLEGLEALRDALINDDPRLIQGSTTKPPPLHCVQDWPVEACCAISYCGWQDKHLTSVGEVEEFFARTCFEIDQLLDEPAGCRHFLNWFDETPRKEVLEQLLSEVNLVITNRVAIEKRVIV